VWKKAWQKPAIDAVKKLWKTEYRDKAVIPASSRSIEHQHEPDAYDLWDRDQSMLTQIDDELEAFINDTPTNPGGLNALEWWLVPERQITYPNLFYMAVDILSIPPMSAEPERIFSGARRTISWQRMRLGIDTIQKTECLKSWIRSGITLGWHKLGDAEFQEGQEVGIDYLSL
jgi:hypothetical protein